MSNDAFESCMFLKLDGGSMKMIEALQTHLALEYEFFETPDIRQPKLPLVT